MVKPNRITYFLLGLMAFIGMILQPAAYAGQTSKNLPRKLAVATYYERVLQQKYGMASLSVQGSNDEIPQISMVRITGDRIKEILGSGLYREAKKAKFRIIRFIDINQNESIVNVR